MSAKRAYTVVGTRPPRYDAADKTTGRAIFGPDVNLPDLLHGQILRSPTPTPASVPLTSAAPRRSRASTRW